MAACCLVHVRLGVHVRPGACAAWCMCGLVHVRLGCMCGLVRVRPGVCSTWCVCVRAASNQSTAVLLVFNSGLGCSDLVWLAGWLND